MSDYAAQVSSVDQFTTGYVRDKLGRITQKVETVQGVAHTFDYTYNTAGYLVEVKRDGLVTATYTYDLNGNRLNNGAVYDDQDRLTSTSTASYTYTDNGELLTKTEGADNTQYKYDVLGNLLSVNLPDGTLIEYIIDGRNRRIGKKVDGVLQQAWLYKDGLNPVYEEAWDSASSTWVQTRFVYASRANVPDFVIRDNVTYRIIADHLGSPRLVINTASGSSFCLFPGDSSPKLFRVTLNDSNTSAGAASRDGFIIVLRILVYVFAFTRFSYITADPDLWGHIRFGQDIWQQGGIHDTDPFSYTAGGQPWINHEWLMEVLFYLIYDAFDSTGLLVFKAALGIFIVHLLSSLYFARTGNTLVYLAVFALIIPVMAPGFMTRPHLATFLFLTLMVTVLHRFFDGNHRIIKWMPLIMLVWVNSHGGVVAGLGIFGMITAIELVRCFLRGERRGGILLKYFALSCLAVLVNPYGYKLWLFFIHSLGMPRAISEWGPIALTDASHWQYKVLVLLFIGTFFLPNKKRVWEIGVLVLAIVYGFRHQRHTVLTAILIAPYLLAQYGRWLQWDIKPYYDRLSNHFHWVAQTVLGLFALLILGLQLNKYAADDFKIRVDPLVYPTYAAQFMKANGLEGNMVVPFNWGEYIIWKSPGSRVSIDGRFRTVYPEDIIEMNRAFAYGKPQGMALLRDYPTVLVLTKINEAPHTFMEKMPGWQKLYQDPISKLFIRSQEIIPDHPLWQRILENEKKRNGGPTFLQPKDPPPWPFPG